MSGIREIQTTYSKGPPEYCTVQECSELSQRVAYLERDIKGLFDMFKAEQERTDNTLQEIIDYAGLSAEQHRGNVRVPQVGMRMARFGG